jgi:hypothetical protein
MTEQDRLALKGRDMADLIGQLRAAPARLRSSVDGLTMEELEAHPVPGTWSMRECVEHIALVSLGWTNIFYEAIGPYHDNIRNRNPEWAAPEEARAKRSLVDALDVYSMNNARVADYLATLPPDDWTRPFDRVQWLPCRFEIRDHLHWGLLGHLDHHLIKMHDKRVALGKPLPWMAKIVHP